MSIATPVRNTVAFFAETRKDDKLMFAALLGITGAGVLAALLLLAMVVGLILGLTDIIPMHAGGTSGPVGTHPIIMPRVPIIHSY